MSRQLTVAVASGDGIGPEITRAVMSILAAAGVTDRVQFVPVEMGRSVFERGNTRGISDQAIETVESCGVLLKGPMETAKGAGGKSVNVTVRKLWSTFANLRHFTTLPGVETVYTRAGISVNFYIVRENVEDTYAGIEHRVAPDVTQCRRLISAPGSDQVHRFAFETAARLGLSTVCCGHKANIMKMTDGLFLERFRVVAADYPAITARDVIIDALCLDLVMRPQQYGLIVLPNLQGDIVSDLAAGLIGGLGFAPSANIGRHIAIFEAVHGTAPDIAGRDIANPTALLLSAIMMLRHVGLLRAAATIENALLCALERGARTADFGNPARPALTTTQFAQAIAQRLGERPTSVPPRPVPQADAPPPPPPRRPDTHHLLRTFGDVPSRVVGCDLYLDTSLPPATLAPELSALCADTPLMLQLISNRGTMVWPTGSPYTECVGHFRARFVRRPQAPEDLSQAPCLDLLRRAATRFTVCSYELLREYDGVPGYTPAQGQ